jgi:hypothetical protein
MARRPDLPCADCGKLMWSGTTSLPPGRARCLPCRRAVAPSPPMPRIPVGEQAHCTRCSQPFIKATINQQLCRNPCRPMRSGSDSKLRKEHEAKRYPPAHKKLRAQLLAQWQDGDPCARCDGPMRHGEPVDLDHTDDGTGYLGLSHASCNRSQTGRLDRVKRTTVCDHCGVPFETGSRYQVHCSMACRTASKPERPEPTLEMVLLVACRHCGVAFNPRSGAVWCTARCKSEGRRREARIRKRMAAGNPIDAPVRAYTRRSQAVGGL